MYVECMWSVCVVYVECMCSVYVYNFIRDCFREKGPNAYILKFPVLLNRNITLASKCMVNKKIQSLTTP